MCYDPSRMSARSIDRRVLIVLGLCALVVATYSIIRGASGTSDFKNPYRVARVFWETGTLDIRGEPRYPPTVRVLLAPLAALPLGVASAVWTLLSLGAVIALPSLLARLSDVPIRAQALPWLAVTPYLLDAFALGAAEPIDLCLVVAGLALARARRAVAGATLIGLAGMIKVLPICFWGVLLARRRMGAAVAGAIVTLVASGALLVGFAGAATATRAVAEWLAVLREGEGPWGLVATHNSLRENNEALPVVLARTFGDLAPELTRNAVSLARMPLRAIWGMWLAVLVLLGTVWLWCAWCSRRAPPDAAWLGMAAVSAPLMLAATHIAWPHYFVWLLPTALFLARRRRVLIAAAVLGQLGMMVPVFRGLGCHTAISLALFALAARDLLAVSPRSARP